MVIGHAPIIFPAIMRVSIPFSKLLYVPLGVLQFGVALRIVAAITQEKALRMAGGVLNEMAVILLIASLIFLVYRGSKQSALA